MNWIDWIIVITLLIGVADGFREGFVRIVVGFGALIFAFFAASWLNGYVASFLGEWIRNRTLAVFLAYALIFFGITLTGSLIASLIVRAFRLIGLSPVDRLLGGGFGLVRAGVGLMIVAMLMMAFVPNRWPDAVGRSTLAPYIVDSSKILSSLTPYEIRHGVEQKYDELRVQLEKLRSGRKLRIREE
ncbi:MAG: CvpA family protein [Bryobacteraceae bacterium]|nr:CvpA family protein [Bryobacteraceae bacterium]